jgi:hypothetical protein
MFFVAWITSIIVAGIMASKRDRDVVVWIVAALFISWFAVIILAVLGEEEKPRLRGQYPSVQQNVHVTVPGAQVNTGLNPPESRRGLPAPLYREVADLVLSDLEVEQELLRTRAAIVAYRLGNNQDLGVTDDDAIAVLETVKVSLGLLPEPEVPRSVAASPELLPTTAKSVKKCRECGAPAPFGTRECQCGTPWPALTLDEYYEVRRNVT